jgi:hypothetical protein
MKKRAVAFILILFMLSSFAFHTQAAGDQAFYCANTLYTLGLFQGTGTNPDGTPVYDLDVKPTRMQAITMLVRLIGKENEAKAKAWDILFYRC